jgi:formylglycine-generating enzyme required for sulfatase activity
MAEAFEPSTWRSHVAAQWREIARDLPETMRRLGVSTAYGLLTASAWLPLLAAYTSDPGPAVAALAAITSGVGTNLLSNLVQGAYDKARAPQQAEQEVAEQPGLRAEYQRMLAELDVLAVAQQALGDQWAAFEERLQGELARMGGKLYIESGGGAVVLGDVKVKHGDFIGRDQVIHIHLPPSAIDTTPLREAYLRHVADRSGRLPLRGVDIQAGDAAARTERPRLAQVYVELDTTAPRRVRREALPDLLTRKFEGDTAVLEAIAGPEANAPLSVLEVAVGNSRLVLLGAPGSGKSTFVGHMAFCLAMAQLEPEGDWLAHLPGWPQTETDVVPVVVILRDFTRWAVVQGLVQGNAQALDDFIAAWLAEHALTGFAKPLRETLHRGKAVVLLDGLDEVGTHELRALVRDTVDDFARIYGKSRVLVTCRTLSYQDPAWQLVPDEFPIFEISPFDEEKIDRFIGAWYAELAEMKAVQREDAGPLADKLRRAVRRRDLWRLAPNPLLLTVMALVHAHKGRLPESRALLYEDCTDLMLWRWEQVKWQAEKERAPGLRELLAQVGLQEVDLKGALWKLAFEAHAAVGSTDDLEATADIPEVRLLKVLCELHPARSWDWAAEVVAQVKERAGLLLEREPGVYAFPHRTFQEYLAGCHLSVQVDLPTQAAALLDEASFWREVVLLAVGRLVHVSGDVARPLALVAELCLVEAPAGDRGWRRAWLAGDVLLETGVDRAARSGLGRELLARTRERLAALVGGGHLATRERAEAGDVLGKLGDPRPGVGVVVGTTHGAPLPDILWCEVPPGLSLMGSRKDNQEASDDEKPQHKLEISYRYWMARCPVTVAQYACFLETGGYQAQRWWTAVGWAWRQGEWDSQVESEALRALLRWRPAELRGAPMWWEEQREYPNRSVMGVSWFEAMAFGSWLTEQLQVAEEVDGRALRPMPDGYVVRLPTEAEWEKAARSGDDRRYPWGEEDWEPARANIREGGIRHITAVGTYPSGATPSGLLDVAGNVWEWTTSLYRPYPYRVDDGREDPEAEGSRVLRGGSWSSNQGSARCASCSGRVPVDFNGYVGFRVVVSLALPSSDC